MKGQDGVTRKREDAEKRRKGDGEMGRPGDVLETKGVVLREVTKTEERGQVTLPNLRASLSCLEETRLKGILTLKSVLTNAESLQREQLWVRKGGLPPLAPGIKAIVTYPSGLANALLSIATILLFSLSAVAQQIGNPTEQHGVTPPRGTYAIRNAHSVTVSGPDIDNGTIVIRDGKLRPLAPT
jgi:hypothetical protein